MYAKINPYPFFGKGNGVFVTPMRKGHTKMVAHSNRFVNALFPQHAATYAKTVSFCLKYMPPLTSKPNHGMLYRSAARTHARVWAAYADKARRVWESSPYHDGSEVFRMQQYRVGIIGATGMVGQRFSLLLQNHPWFKVVCVAASSRSAGKTYGEAVRGRWAFRDRPVPAEIAALTVLDAADVEAVAGQVDFVFCAVDMKKDEIRALEERYAKAEVPVISNNSANRLTPDVPMLIPEINGDHAMIIEAQRARLHTKTGFIAVKPNCSIQSYVPALWPLLDFEPESLVVCTYQAISGAGKTFESWPEMVDNVIPYIGGEDEKSEREPLKIFGHIEGGQIVDCRAPAISAQCLRVACSDGHMAAAGVRFRHKPTREQILERWENCRPATDGLDLPSSPKKFLTYFDDPSRPQTRLDRELENGMGISIGRLREDSVMDYKFVCLSHNTLRGAAGGGVLSAEYLCKLGYIPHKNA